jgi:hypothetical protein
MLAPPTPRRGRKLTIRAARDLVLAHGGLAAQPDSGTTVAVNASVAVFAAIMLNLY